MCIVDCTVVKSLVSIDIKRRLFCFLVESRGEGEDLEPMSSKQASSHDSSADDVEVDNEASVQPRFGRNASKRKGEHENDIIF